MFCGAKFCGAQNEDRGELSISVQLTTSRIGNHTPVDAQSATCD